MTPPATLFRLPAMRCRFWPPPTHQPLLFRPAPSGVTLQISMSAIPPHLPQLYLPAEYPHTDSAGISVMRAPGLASRPHTPTRHQASTQWSSRSRTQPVPELPPVLQ